MKYCSKKYSFIIYLIIAARSDFVTKKCKFIKATRLSDIIFQLISFYLFILVFIILSFICFFPLFDYVLQSRSKFYSCHVFILLYIIGVLVTNFFENIICRIFTEDSVAFQHWNNFSNLWINFGAYSIETNKQSSFLFIILV